MLSLLDERSGAIAYATKVPAPLAGLVKAKSTNVKDR